MKPQHHRALAALLLMAVFAAGLWRLFAWRFAGGDHYPAYSSYRSDPLGSRALFESLDGISGRRTSRFLGPDAELPAAPGCCLLFLGCPPKLNTSAADATALNQFLHQGGRIVISFAAPTRWQRLADPDGPPTGPPRQPPPTPRGQAPGAVSRADLRQDWGFRLQRLQHSAPNQGSGSAQRCGNTLSLPPELPWFSTVALGFDNEAWEAIYEVKGKPVVARRSVGNGEVVIMTDAYLLSNEALRADLQPEVLAWLIGPSQRLVFDETHLGIQSQQGIMALVRRYRLGGLFLCLLGLAALFVWQSSSRFFPAPPEDPTADALVGKAATTALRDLVHRHIDENHVLEECIALWRRTAPLPEAELKKKIHGMAAHLEAQRHLPRNRRAITQQYQALCDILAEKEQCDDRNH